MAVNLHEFLYREGADVVANEEGTFCAKDKLLT